MTSTDCPNDKVRPVAAAGPDRVATLLNASSPGMAPFGALEVDEPERARLRCAPGVSATACNAVSIVGNHRALMAVIGAFGPLDIRVGNAGGR